MSFSYPPGVTVTPRSASEHAQDALNSINALLAANNVRVDGVLVQLAPSLADIVWLLVLAVGDIRAVYDLILVAAGQMFSVSECSDAQLAACLPLSGTTLIPGAYSEATINVVAAGAGNAVIPDGARVPLGTICNFVVPVGGGVTILAGGNADILVIADVIGPIEAGVGTLIAFDTTIPNVASLTNVAAANVGRNPETFQQIRQRLLTGNIADTNIDGTIRAIRSITGIIDANMWFNTSLTVDLVLTGAIHVLPRTAYILIRGVDPSGVAIAQAYVRRMDAPTKGALSQTYITLAGQLFTILYDTAVAERCYAKVYYDATQPFTVGFDAVIKADVSAIQTKIGQEQTAATVLEALAGFSEATITTVTLSTDGINYYTHIDINGIKYARFLPADVTVIAE